MAACGAGRVAPQLRLRGSRNRKRGDRLTGALAAGFWSIQDSPFGSGIGVRTTPGPTRTRNVARVTHRGRVLSAGDHRESEHVPVDVGGRDATTPIIPAYERLAARRGRGARRGNSLEVRREQALSVDQGTTRLSATVSSSLYGSSESEN